MTINTEKLRDLETKATAGPWHTKTECPGRCCWHIFPELPMFGGTPDEDGSQDCPIVMGECSEDDAAFMVAIRNAAPALLNHIDAQAAEIARLREALIAIEQWNVPIVESQGEAVSMYVAYGSQGVEKHFRGVARAALAQEQT